MQNTKKHAPVKQYTKLDGYKRVQNNISLSLTVRYVRMNSHQIMQCHTYWSTLKFLSVA